jgi:tetratricopeptide (TPR) repeat protein
MVLLHFNKAIIHEDMFEYDRCMQEYEQTLRINPYLTDVYVRQAMHYFNIGNSKKALEIIDDGCKIISECKVVAR